MKKILYTYVFLIAILIGVEISLGAIVAPTIFYPKAEVLSGVLNQFLSGALMSEIFVRYNSFLIIVSIVILVYEMVNFNNNRSESFKIRLSTLMIALINLSLAVIFILFFTDFIINAQKSGIEATKTQKFLTIHKMSEVCMGIMMIIQIVLFFIKIPKLGDKNAK